MGTSASAAGGQSYKCTETILPLPRFISQVFPGGLAVAEQVTFSSKTLRGSHCFPNKALLTGTFPAVLDWASPFLPSLSFHGSSSKFIVL